MTFANNVTRLPLKSNGFAIDSVGYGQIAVAKIIEDLITEAADGTDAFADTRIDLDADGRVTVYYDGAGYDYLSQERGLDYPGDLRERIENALAKWGDGLFPEDVNGYSFTVYA